MFKITIPVDATIKVIEFKNDKGENIKFFESRFIADNVVYIARSAYEFKVKETYIANIKTIKYVEGLKFITFTLSLVNGH